MPRTYADLLREARAQIREVTPQEVDALPPATPTVVDVREESEWEQGHLPGALHISKSYVEQQIEAAVPDRDAPGRPVLRRRRPLAVRRPGPRAARLHERRLDVAAGSRPGSRPGCRWDTPVILTAEQKQRYSRHLLIPEVGAAGQARLLGSQGAVHRRRRSRLPGSSLSRGRRRRHDRDRRLRRRRPVEPPAPDPPHERSGGRAQGRVGPQDDQRPEPGRERSSPTRRCSSPTTSTGSSPATT